MAKAKKKRNTNKARNNRKGYSNVGKVKSGLKNVKVGDSLWSLDMRYAPEEMKQVLDSVAKEMGIESFSVSPDKVEIVGDNTLYFDDLGIHIVVANAKDLSSVEIKSIVFKRDKGKWEMLIIDSEPPPSVEKQNAHIDIKETGESLKFQDIIVFPLPTVRDDWMTTLKTVAVKIEPFTYRVPLEKVTISPYGMVIEEITFYFPLSIEMLEPIADESIVGIVFRRDMRKREWQMILEIEGDDSEKVKNAIHECCKRFLDFVKKNKEFWEGLVIPLTI